MNKHTRLTKASESSLGTEAKYVTGWNVFPRSKHYPYNFVQCKIIKCTAKRTDQPNLKEVQVQCRLDYIKN